jgi:hypothetical protein
MQGTRRSGRRCFSADEARKNERKLCDAEFAIFQKIAVFAFFS